MCKLEYHPNGKHKEHEVLRKSPAPLVSMGTLGKIFLKLDMQIS